MPKPIRLAATGTVVTRDNSFYLIATTPDAARSTAIMLNKGYISPRAYADREADLIRREIRG